MKTSAKGINHIKKYEGFSALPYLCPANYLTIGYGHVIKGFENFPQPISKPQAENILAADLISSETAVKKLITAPLNQNQFDALVSFTFNLGAGALQRSTLRQKVNRGEHVEVAEELMKWVYAGGKKLPGLMLRRLSEALLYTEPTNL